MNIARLFDALIEADSARQADIAKRENLARLRVLATPRCGSCDSWMKSSSCPREHNFNGYTRGPDSGGYPCSKFVGNSRFVGHVAEYRTAIKPAEGSTP